jgi:hypothetical protein
MVDNLTLRGMSGARQLLIFGLLVSTAYAYSACSGSVCTNSVNYASACGVRYCCIVGYVSAVTNCAGSCTNCVVSCTSNQGICAFPSPTSRPSATPRPSVTPYYPYYYPDPAYSSSRSSGGFKFSVPVIAGIAAGAVGLITLIAVVVFLVRRNRTTRRALAMVSMSCGAFTCHGVRYSLTGMARTCVSGLPGCCRDWTRD